MLFSLSSLSEPNPRARYLEIWSYTFPMTTLTNLEQVRRVVTAIPGPKSNALIQRRAEAVSGGLGLTFPVAIERASDAILLDVDNGPEGLTRRVNDDLYSAEGLDAARTALKPGGVLAVWSAFPDPAFARRLAEAGFAVTECAVSEGGDDEEALHMIWFAKKPN